MSNAYFLRAAYNEIRKARGEEEVDPLEFADLMDEKLELVDMDPAMLDAVGEHRLLGRREEAQRDSADGGARAASSAILDETDSGLDIDALRIVADGVNKLKRPDNATIVVTHYQRLLNYIVPDFVHVLANGRIVKSGGKELALELEDKGYDWVTSGAPAASAGRGERVTASDDRRQPVESYVEAFDALTSDAPAPAWLQSLRRAAFERFAALGFPTTKNEDWHFTSVAPIAEQEFVLLDGAERRRAARGARAVQVRRVRLAHDGVRERPVRAGAVGLRQAADGRDAARSRVGVDEPRRTSLERVGKIASYDVARVHGAQHGVHARRRACVEIANDVEVDAADPPAVRHRRDGGEGDDASAQPHHVGRHAKATVIESYVSTSDAMYFTNAVTEVSRRRRRDAAALQDAARGRARVPRRHDRGAPGARQPLRVVRVRDRRRAVAHEHLHDARRRRRAARR